MYVKQCDVFDMLFIYEYCDSILTNQKTKHYNYKGFF